MTAQLLLAALGHAAPAEATADGGAVAATVAWLEDTKIRALPLEARAALRNPAADVAWEAAFGEYLAQVGCPVPAARRGEALTWLLGHAVSLEYSDAADAYATRAAEGDADADVAADALSGVSTPAFWEALRGAAASLGVAAAPAAHAAGDAAAVAEADSLAAAAAPLAWLAALPPDERSRLAAAAAAAADAPGSFPLGFEAPSAALARPAALLRARHVAALRELQSRADAALVAAQEATADPRTDSKLGRVGR